jgi:hypothetical protein
VAIAFWILLAVVMGLVPSALAISAISAFVRARSGSNPKPLDAPSPSPVLSAYRHPADGAAEQTASRRLLVDELEARLTPLYRAMLPEDVQSDLLALRTRADTAMDLGTATASLETLAHHLEAALASPALALDCSDDVPLPDGEQFKMKAIELNAGMPPNPNLIERFERLAGARVRAIVGPDVRVEPWRGLPSLYDGWGAMLTADAIRSGMIDAPEDGGRLFRFRVRGVPFLLAGNARVFRFYDGQPTDPTRNDTGDGLFSSKGPIRTRMFLRTTMPRALRLAVQPEGVRHKVAKALSFAKEVELGDPEFDPKFFVQGNVAVATALLVGAMRRALLDIQGNHPSLSIRDGVAELSYLATYDVESAHAVLSESALDVLTFARDAAGAKAAEGKA